MFDIGFLELSLLFVIGLLVLGPERLPRVARTIGMYLRKARRTWYSVRSEIEQELAAEDLKRSLAEPAEELKRQMSESAEDLDNIRRSTQEALDPTDEPPVAPDGETSTPRDDDHDRS